MLIERLVKIIMSGGLALLCALIALGKILDPEPNLSFVRHVLSMDTITPGGSAAVRAMPIPTLRRVSFWLIVTGEAVAAVLFALGTVELTRAREVQGVGLSRGQALHPPRRRVRFPHLVRRLYRRRRRMVSDVDVGYLERPTGCFSHLRVHSPGPDLRRPAGRRAGGALSLRKVDPHPCRPQCFRLRGAGAEPSPRCVKASLAHAPISRSALASAT